MFPFASAADMLPGLLPAAYRGIQIHVVNAEHDLGRRITTQYFPGTDIKAVDDRGRAEGRVRVNAFVIGDDYVSQAAALGAALQAPGPGMYLCPWRGPLQVIPTDSCSIKFDHKELRVARVTLQLETVPNAGLSLLSSLAGLIGAVAGALGGLSGFVGAALGATAAAVAVVTAVARATGTVAGLVSAAVGRSAANVQIGPTVEPLLRPLEAPAGLAPAAIGASVVSVIGQVADAVRVATTPALAPREPLPAPAVSAAAGVSLMLAIGAALGQAERLTVADASVYVAAEAAAVLAAVDLAADLPYESRRDASAWRDRLMAAIDAASASAERLVPVAADPALSLLGNLAAVRSAVSRDINEVIGRLPAVRLVEPRTCTAWILAQAIAGDEPARLVAFVGDVVSRNRLEHQGALPARPLEVLR